MDTEVARVPVRIVAYDAPGDGTIVRLFTTTLFVSDVAVSQAPDEETVRVGLHRKETVSTATGVPAIHDGAYLAVDVVAVRLDAPLGDRRVIDDSTGDPVPTVAGAVKRRRDGLPVAKAIAAAAAGGTTSSWRLPRADG
jgi:hypothetical protein